LKVIVSYKVSHVHQIFTCIPEKYPYLPAGENRELLAKADDFFRTFVHVTRDYMALSGIPWECLVEITKESSVKQKYEIAFDKVAYIRDAVTSKRCKAMACVKEICEGKYLAKVKRKRHVSLFKNQKC
jgi:hypothetical protein